ncbi:MAG: TonB-dependent receptor [Muribaculaceae bacterium]|nr:TonB-dependent receptor [Muribaculaceae bacterium]
MRNKLIVTLAALLSFSAAMAQTKANFANGTANTMPESKVQAPSKEEPDTLFDELDEIVVVAEKPVVTVADGKVNYNVEEDPASAGSNVLDMLRKVPMVNVDGEGNISISGANSFKIQMDGKDYPGISDNASTIFRSMPASAIIRIEVITEPGVKADAEGASAILNFITQKKQSQDGYNANLSLNLGRMNSGLSGFARMKKEKFTGSVNATYGTNIPFHTTSEIYSVNDYFNEGETDNPYKTVYSNMKQKSKFHYAQAGFNLGYEPNSNHLFTVNFKFDKIIPRADVTEWNKSVFPLLDPLVYNNNIKTKIDFSNINTGVSYQHNFSDKHYIVASYQYAYGHSAMDLTYDYDYQYVTDAPSATRNATFNYNRENTIQADYSLPVGDIHTIDLGIKTIFRNNSAYGQSYTGFSVDDLLPNESLNTNVRQLQDIGAVYAQYTARIGDFSAIAGFRYEHSYSAIKNRKNPAENFHKRMNDIVPSATLNWNITPMSSLRLHYSQSINRPTINDLNPFTGINLMDVVITGNPNLKSQKNHKVALSYSSFGQSFGGSVSLQYAQSNGMISSVFFVEDGKSISKPFNIGHSRTPELNVMLNYTIIPRMTFTLSGRVAYTDISGNGYSNHGWTGSGNANWSYMLLNGFSFNAYGGYNSRNIMLQGTSGAFYYYGISASKTLLADRSLTLSVNAGNFLQDRMTSHLTTISKNNRLVRDMKFQSWNVGVSLSWNFGFLSGLNDKKTSKTINNDDVINTAPSTTI